jgi:hypothetical protein
MKVRELLFLLEREDPDAEVYLAYQPSYPLEATLANVVSREEVEEAEGDAGERSARRAGAAANDVLLVEGNARGLRPTGGLVARLGATRWRVARGRPGRGAARAGGAGVPPWAPWAPDRGAWTRR